MAGRGQAPFRPSDFEWAGPRLRQAMGQASTSSNLDKTGLTLLMFHSAVADAEEQTKAGQFHNATLSYNFAVGAAKKGRLLDLERLLELICSYAESLLRDSNWGDAFRAALETTGMKPDFVRGYMLMCKAAKGEGNLVSGAEYLLQGMTHCNMSNDEKVDFIAEAAELLGALKHKMIEGQFIVGEVGKFYHYNPSLPQTIAIWTRIVARLLKEKKFMAVAYLTVGFTEYSHFERTLSCFDNACPEEVDCASGNVDELYETLSTYQLKRWGERLAVYLLDHGAAIGKQTKDPLGVHLVKLSIKHQSKKLLSHILTSQPCDNIQPDAVDPEGDTALHVIVKSQPYTHIHNDLTVQLIKQGALPNIRDRAGKMPHEYVPSQYHKSALYVRVTSALKKPEEGFKGRIANLKQEGNQAHRAKNSQKAREFYQQAITAIEKSPYQMPRELAILYNNMAAVYASIGNNEKACEMAARSVEIDPAYHKPYWRLGKSLMEKKQYRTACDKFLSGVVCSETDEDQRVLFVQEVCSMLPSLSDKDAEEVVKQLAPHLTARWPKLVETLSKNTSWDIIRRLVLGPPQKSVDKSVVPVGWRFADCYKEGKPVKVGYAFSLKANTPTLSTLVEAAESGKLSGTLSWVTDLVLALLLQGAQLQSLVTGDEETCYHTAVYLCCLTEKLGLIRYILSEEPLTKIAVSAVNREKRTLLHSACLQFGNGRHEVGKQLVRLLLEKGVNPAATDVLSKKAVDYVALRVPSVKCC